MDNSSFGSPLGRTLASPSRKRLSMVQSLKKSNSGLSVCGRTNQSIQIICRTPNHVVESFGTSLPVLVTEALTFVEKNTSVSMNISIDGWAWLVCGRRLLVWQCKSTPSEPKQRRGHFNSQCRELLLPQSDIAYKAECIAVWLPTDHQVPSCLAVSPEGVVRFWPNIAHEGISVETSAELAGQEVDCVTYIPNHGCILTTTTCTIVLLHPQTVSGKITVTCRVLRTSQGWFGGIGRRMSSLIFGAMPQTSVMETKLVKVTCTEVTETGAKVLILAGNSLQSWWFPNNSNEQESIEFEQDISQRVSSAFQRKLWESNVCTTTTWLIDMQSCEEGIVILMGAHCPDMSSYVSLAIGLIPRTDNGIGNSFKWLIPIKTKPIVYKDDTESMILSYHLMICDWEAIVYNKQNIYVLNCTSEHDQERIDLIKANEDNILGGAVCSGTPVLFSKNLGLVSIMPVDLMIGHEFNSSDMFLGNEQTLGKKFDTFSILLSNDEVQEMFVSSDSATQLRAAFILNVRGDKSQCEEILLNLFPLQEEPIMEIDSNLDNLVLRVGMDLIDDYPANDPRWTNHRDLSMTVNSVTSIRIPGQLEGKRKALDIYVEFLKENNLWNRFSGVRNRGVVTCTAHVLAEFGEKLIAALTIYSLHSRYPEIDVVIEKMITPGDDLTARDLFYRKVSTINGFFSSLIKEVCELTLSERTPTNVAENLIKYNSILLNVLSEIMKYRQYNADRFLPSRRNNYYEYLPWTASAGLVDDLRTILDVSLKHGIAGTHESSNLRKELYEQILSIVDFILDGKKSHLESIRGTEKYELVLKQYEFERTRLIETLIKRKQFEFGTILGEKYCDFVSLIEICELTEDRIRLDKYIDKFAGQDFAGVLFNWYDKNGKQSQMIDKCRTNVTLELNEKLSEHPHLAWIQAGLSEDYRTAGQTLRNLAGREYDLVGRKKSQLSLAKLALLASEEGEEDEEDEEEEEDDIQDEIASLDKELNLIAHQEDIPNQVIQSFGFDIDKLRVMSPRELITLYTSDDNIVANEYDFKKALDLLEYLPIEEEKDAVKLQIWAKAVGRDKECWNRVDVNPESQVRNSLFFKLMDMVYFMGIGVDELVPSYDRLIEEHELEEFNESKNFLFLIKLVYEYADKNYYMSRD